VSSASGCRVDEQLRRDVRPFLAIQAPRRSPSSPSPCAYWPSIASRLGRRVCCVLRVCLGTGSLATTASSGSSPRGVKKFTATHSRAIGSAWLLQREQDHRAVFQVSASLSASLVPPRTGPDWAVIGLIAGIIQTWRTRPVAHRRRHSFIEPGSRRPDPHAGGFGLGPSELKRSLEECAG